MSCYMFSYPCTLVYPQIHRLLGSRFSSWRREILSGFWISLVVDHRVGPSKICTMTGIMIQTVRIPDTSGGGLQGWPQQDMFCGLNYDLDQQSMLGDILYILFPNSTNWLPSVAIVCLCYCSVGENLCKEYCNLLAYQVGAIGAIKWRTITV